METANVQDVDAAKITPLDSPEVARAKIEKAKAKRTKKVAKKAAKAIKKVKKSAKRALKAVKKAAKAVKKAEKKSKRAYSDAEVAKELSGFTTKRQLAKALKVTVPAAQNYIEALKKVRKLETKEIRQGKRGPLALAYRA